MLIYVGGPALTLLERLPFLGANPVGRLRSVFGFLLAGLAAAGFDSLSVEGRLGIGPRKRLLRGVVVVGAAAAVAYALARGWQIAGAAGYALTPRAEHRLDNAAARIYRTTANDEWDGHWHLVIPDRPTDRATRERLRSALAYLGYAPLGDGTWLAARPSPVGCRP